MKKVKLDLRELASQVRTQDVQGTLNLLKANFMVFASWGGNKFENYDHKILKFKVNGHHHKGNVIVVVNGADLYDVYLTTSHMNIVDKLSDIYFDELTSRIDNRIERISDYESEDEYERRAHTAFLNKYQ